MLDGDQKTIVDLLVPIQHLESTAATTTFRFILSLAGDVHLFHSASNLLQPPSFQFALSLPALVHMLPHHGWIVWSIEM